jgi:large subunit ribosomal protein L14e
LIDGEGISRQVIPVRRLQLTKHIVKVLRGAKTGKVKSIVKKENVAQKFAQSSLGKAYASQARRESLNDFERYKVLVLRRKLAKLTRINPNKKK